MPELDGPIERLSGRKQVKLLNLALDRMTRWHCPGAVGDRRCRSCYEPLGGVGINVAVQDAVAAANGLADLLAPGENLS